MLSAAMPGDTLPCPADHSVDVAEKPKREMQHTGAIEYNFDALYLRGDIDSAQRVYALQIATLRIIALRDEGYRSNSLWGKVGEQVEEISDVCELPAADPASLYFKTMRLLSNGERKFIDLVCFRPYNPIVVKHLDKPLVCKTLDHLGETLAKARELLEQNA